MKLHPGNQESPDGGRQGALRIGLDKWKVIYPDLFIGALLAGFAFFGAYQVAGQINPILYEYGAMSPGDIGLKTTDIWFDADLPKMKKLMTDRQASIAGFTEKHPLFWAVAFSWVSLLRKLSMDTLSAIKTLTAAVASTWTVLFFILLRLITARRFDAALFCILAVASASAMFWLVVPEVFSFGSVSIIIALCVAALIDRRIFSAASYVIVSAITLSMTVTNWMVGILVTFAGQPWRRTLQITVNAFFMVSLLWGVQKYGIPSADYFMTFGRGNKAFVLHPASGGPLKVINSFVSHTMVMPDIHVQTKSDPLWYGMTIQHSLPGSATIWGGIAVVLWVALLGMGIYGLIVAKHRMALRIVLPSIILLQLLLHVLYGRETFLYSLHYAPLLIAVSAIGTLTKYRMITLTIAALLLVAAGVNNGLQLMRAIEVTNEMAALADAYKYIPIK